MFHLYYYKGLNALSTWLVIIFLGFVFSLTSANTATAQNNFTGRLLNPPGPFGSNNALLAMDEQGFLWTANNQGIWRFDGAETVPFSLEKLKIGSEEIIGNIYFYDGFMFVTAYKDNLHVYDMQADTAYVFHFKKRFLNFTPAGKGRVLFFTTDGQGYYFSRKKLLEQGPDLRKMKGWQPKMYAGSHVRDTVTGREYMWLGNWAGYFKGDSITAATLNPAGTPDGLMYKSSIDVKVTSRYFILSFTTGFAVYDKNTLALLYTYRGHEAGVNLLMGDTLVVFDKRPDGKISPQLQSPLFHTEPAIFEDSVTLLSILPSGYPGRFFSSTDVGLAELLYHTNKIDTFYNRTTILKHSRRNSIRSVLRWHNKLYTGTYNGFFVYEGRKVKKISGHIVYSIAPADDDHLLLGIENEQGFAEYNRITNTVTLLFKQKFAGGITSLIKQNNTFLAGSSGVIYQLAIKNRQWQVQPVLSDTGLGFIRQIEKTGNDVFFATQTGFYCLHGQGSLQKLFPANKKMRVNAFIKTAWGWALGTHGNGLVMINNAGRVVASYGVEDGVPGAFVYSLTTARNIVVAGCSGGAGIFIIDSTHLTPLPVNTLYAASGLTSQEFNHNANFYDTISHQIILGGLDGLAFLDEKYLSSYLAPSARKISLAAVKSIESKTQQINASIMTVGLDKIVIPPGNNFISLKFACAGNFNQTIALFRLLGFNDAWQAFKLDHDVSFAGLPPGNYKIQVKLPGSANEQEWLVKDLKVLPEYYQTIWFKALIILASAFVVWYIWRRRLQSLLKEQYLRTTIASDLHDEIGSTLTRISFNSELMMIQGITKDKRLSQISDDSKKAISSIADVIWSIDAYYDNNQDLLTRMKEYAVKMLEDTAESIAFNHEGFEKIDKMPQVIRQNLYLIFKEALNNIVKHNHQPAVSITLKNNSEGITMVISNTIRVAATQGVTGGQGLRSMAARSKKINAQFTATADNGFFTVKILVAR